MELVVSLFTALWTLIVVILTAMGVPAELAMFGANIAVMGITVFAVTTFVGLVSCMFKVGVV